MRILGLVLLLLFPVKAAALSCLAPSVVRSFQQYHAADDTYVVVQGKLHFDPALLPRKSFGETPPPEMTRVPATLTGKSMARTGFDRVFVHPVTLEVACFGPWCGGADNGGEVLAFVKVVDDTYLVDINPCGGAVFANPTSDQTKEVLDCFNGKACTAP